MNSPSDFTDSCSIMCKESQYRYISPCVFLFFFFVFFLTIGCQKNNGNSTTHNEPENVIQLRSRADKGDAIAQLELGVIYYKGEGIPQDKATAIKLFLTAAELGNAEAQNQLGICYLNGYGVELNHEEAVKWFRKAAELGNPVAQNNLGACYDQGNGVEQKPEEAVKWFRKAAEQGESGAQFNLGLCYEKGDGVEQNLKEASNWYRKAAEQGDVAAQCNLGAQYVEGRGVEQNLEEAEKWYRKAAEQGDVMAQLQLGGYYYYKTNNEDMQNRLEAVKWYRKAAEQGNADAQYNMGVFYTNGYGVKMDLPEAVKWYRLATEQGHELAQKTVKKIEKWAGNSINLILDKNVKLEMIRVKAGTFQMGSPENEHYRGNGEELRNVTIAQDYWLGKYEITNEQIKIVNWKCNTPEDYIRDFEAGEENFPAYSISYANAKSFCDKMNNLFKNVLLPGYHFDLPTESQWEYACRAGTNTAFSFGEYCNAQECNCDGRSPYGPISEGPYRGFFCKVGSYPPNAWGFYDMHGNVNEWCLGEVLRGGSWYTTPVKCRSAARTIPSEQWYPELLLWNRPDGIRLAIVPDSDVQY